MLLHADLSSRAVNFADEAEWMPSPMAGVERRMLERDGEEWRVPPASSATGPEASLRRHEHALGEEFLVLVENFRGNWVNILPAPTSVIRRDRATHVERGWLRTVRQAAPVPSRGPGADFVDTRSAEWFPGITRGIAVLPLHGFGSERVLLVRWSPNIRFLPHEHPGGEEFSCSKALWRMMKAGSRHAPFSLEGCLLYVKIGHLPAVVTVDSVPGTAS